MKPTQHELEAISVRRARVVDESKIRYRVYSSPAEYIAVIADSALMAVKVSGVARPYKIMRDLPTEGATIDLVRAQADERPEQVPLAVTPQPKSTSFVTELPEQEPSGPQFVPLDVSELRRREGTSIRILSPDMVHEIIEDYTKQHMPAPATDAAVPLPDKVTPPPAPPMAPVSAAEPPLSAAEKLSQLAQEILPSAADMAPEPPPAPKTSEVLSAEEVDKLING